MGFASLVASPRFVVMMYIKPFSAIAFPFSPLASVKIPNVLTKAIKAQTCSFLEGSRVKKNKIKFSIWQAIVCLEREMLSGNKIRALSFIVLHIQAFRLFFRSAHTPLTWSEV